MAFLKKTTTHNNQTFLVLGREVKETTDQQKIRLLKDIKQKIKGSEQADA